MVLALICCIRQKISLDQPTIIRCYPHTSPALTLAHEGVNQMGLEQIPSQVYSPFSTATSAKGVSLQVTKREARIRHHH